jgi:membrane-bound lytic murein transglycosylase A
LLRLNYDAHNGYSRASVGRVLIERSLINREEMSLDRIKQWMATHPEEAKEVRATNRSYLFFRITGINNEDEPTDAQGVSLHPGRSIAVDRTHAFGTPFFIEADLPITTCGPNTKFRRLMIAQDTGSAIMGPARADIYWGAGGDAGRIAERYGGFEIPLRCRRPTGGVRATKFWPGACGSHSQPCAELIELTSLGKVLVPISRV